MMMNMFRSFCGTAAVCLAMSFAATGSAQTTLSCPSGTVRILQESDRGSDRYALRCTAAPAAAVTAADAKALSPDTRVLQRHIYENRRNALTFALPKGYRPVWTDGRLNPRRAERTLAPAQARAAVVPPGYRRAWRDERLNTQRGPRSQVSDANSARIWTDESPRRLAPQPLDVPVLRVDLD